MLTLVPVSLESQLLVLTLSSRVLMEESKMNCIFANDKETGII